MPPRPLGRSSEARCNGSCNCATGSRLTAAETHHNPVVGVAVGRLRLRLAQLHSKCVTAATERVRNGVRTRTSSGVEEREYHEQVLENER